MHLQTIILWAMHYIPFLRLRCDDETEIIGVDDGEMGEFAYDYVGIETELGPRHMYTGNVGATGGGREPVHQVKTSTSGSEYHSDVGSQHPLNANSYPMKPMRA